MWPLAAAKWNGVAKVVSLRNSLWGGGNVVFRRTEGNCRWTQVGVITVANESQIGAE